MLTFLIFGVEHVLRPVIPLVVVERGGDAVLVGVFAAIHALPSVLFRPFIGRLIDGLLHGRLMRFGALTASAASVGVLLPGLGVLGLVRFLQGSVWAVTSVSVHALMAKLAPSDRRGEASGYFMVMPAIATLLAPGLGVALYAVTGALGPVLVAGTLAFVAFLITLRVRIPGDGRTPESVAAGRIWEASALPATLMVTTFMAAHALFTVFPPVYVLAIGAPVASLVVYYPVYGLVMTVSQLFAGRISDRFGRDPTIRIGCGIAIVGLAVAALGTGMPSLMAGGAAYAIAVSLVSPTLSAVTMDRAPDHRIGAAMATYTVGYQMATGASSLVWGTIVAAFGFGWAFSVAIGLQLITITASHRFVRTRG